MFTELPIAIREAVFDLLVPEDRAKLNIALPRDQKIVRTMKTTVDKTKKLGVFVKALKRRPQISLSESTKRWICSQYADDPAADELFNQYKIERPKLEEPNTTLLDKLLTYTESETIIKEAMHICFELSKLTPKQFDQTIEQAGEFWKLFTNSNTPYSVVLSVISNENEDLLSHIVTRCQTIKDEVSEFLLADIKRQSSNIDLLAMSGTKVGLVIRHILGYVRIVDLELLVNTAVKNAYTDTIEVLMRAGLL